MIRVLVVLGEDANVNTNQYLQSFSDMHLLVVRDTESLMRLVCQHNPDGIVSIGKVTPENSLWKLPLWRRLRWLNLSDESHSGDAVRQAVLSLIAATCGQTLFVEDVLISACCLSANPEDIAFACRSVHDADLNENFQFPVEQSNLHEVISLLGNHPVGGSLYSIPNCSGESVIEKLQHFALWSKGHCIWPLTRGSAGISKQIIDRAIEVLKQGKVNAVIVGSDNSKNQLLSELHDTKTVSVDQLFVRPTSLILMNRFGNDFPLKSLAGLILNLLASETIEFIPSAVPVSTAPNDWWIEPDEHRTAMKNANIRYVRHLQENRN